MANINESRKTNSLKKFLGIDKTISTIGIISPENAMGKQFSTIENNKRVEKMKHILKNMLTPYKRVKGMYNQLEHSFIRGRRMIRFFCSRISIAQLMTVGQTP